MAEHKTSRAHRVRRQGDYDPTNQGKANWKKGGFAPGDVDRRHNYEAHHIPSWDKSPQADMARRFARWKYDNPVAYSDVNNMTGNAEEWFFDNGGDVGAYDGGNGEIPPIFASGLMFIGFGLVAIIMMVPLSWFLIDYAPNSLGWDVHWALQGLGLVLGAGGIIGLLTFFVGFAMALIGAPFALLKLIFRILAWPFRSAETKEKARKARIARKDARLRVKRERAERAANKKAKRQGRRVSTS